MPTPISEKTWKRIPKTIINNLKNEIRKNNTKTRS